MLNHNLFRIFPILPLGHNVTLAIAHLLLWNTLIQIKVIILMMRPCLINIVDMPITILGMMLHEIMMTQMITVNLVVEEDLRMIQILVMEVVVPPILDPLVADLLEAHLVHQTHQTLPTILLSMKEAYNS